MYRFIGKESWRGEFRLPDTRDYFDKYGKFYGKVEILRPLLFFHEGQKDITIKYLKKFFTDNAILSFIQYEFIRVEAIDKEGKVEGYAK